MIGAIQNTHSQYFKYDNNMIILCIPTSDYVSQGTVVTNLYLREIHTDETPYERTDVEECGGETTYQISNETFQYTLYYEM